jgi:hypothetical protein
VLSFQQIFTDEGPAGGKAGARVHFCITRELAFGQGLKLAGGPEGLGAWNHTKGPDMKWHDGHRWSAHVRLPPGT